MLTQQNQSQIVASQSCNIRAGHQKGEGLPLYKVYAWISKLAPEEQCQIAYKFCWDTDHFACRCKEVQSQKTFTCAEIESRLMEIFDKHCVISNDLSCCSQHARVEIVSFKSTTGCLSIKAAFQSSIDGAFRSATRRWLQSSRVCCSLPSQ